jgi:murein DD-endopeptidase MepM/ murein hydrolase activator NlpD
VQDGDTLSQVAGLFNVSVNTIVWANELGSAKDIHPGQTLLILPISGIQHTVAKGDTVKSLASTYGGDAGEIIAYNELPEDGTLTSGTVITIPGGAMVEDEEEASNDGSTRTAQKGTIVSSGPSVSGYFIHPLPGAVRTQGIHGYNGVDYGASVGTQVRASAPGTVIVSRASGWNGGYGQYVVIDHPNGTQTLYAHLSRNAVWQGQKVVAGQVVGDVGNTGRSTGPHLHFEVRGAKNPF